MMSHKKGVQLNAPTALPSTQVDCLDFKRAGFFKNYDLLVGFAHRQPDLDEFALRPMFEVIGRGS